MINKILNHAAKFYFWALLLLFGIIIYQVITWMQYYPLHECIYCVEFEAKRKLADYLEYLLYWHVSLIPTSLTYGYMESRNVK